MDALTEQSTILVVDDTPENVLLLSDILRPVYKVRAANSGEGALRLAGSDSQPDLILLDIMMPGMDGFEVCRRLKRNLTTRRIPVIFVTALNEIDDEARGFQVGAVDYITKPVSPPIVRARVETHLHLYNQNRALELKVAQRTAEVVESRLDILRRLGLAGEFKDNETGLHVVRVSNYARIIGLAAGLDPMDAELLSQAAPLHDVGKIGIPDSILKKPGRLNADEWEIMRTHAEIGAKLLGEQVTELVNLAASVALTHHEKWNGEGYPYGLKGEEIPIEGRITALADVFDALTTERPYKEAWTVEAAVAQIQQDSGTHFDPRLVECFMRALPEIRRCQQDYAEKSKKSTF